MDESTILFYINYIINHTNNEVKKKGKETTSFIFFESKTLLNILFFSFLELPPEAKSVYVEKYSDSDMIVGWKIPTDDINLIESIKVCVC